MKINFFTAFILLGILAFSAMHCFEQRVPEQQAAFHASRAQQDSHQVLAQGLCFTENRGQVADLNGRLRPDILFTAQRKGVKLFLGNNGIHYQFRRNFAKPQQDEEKTGRLAKPEIEEVDSTQFYGLDLSLQGANPHPRVINEGAGVSVENFFLAHCPEGIFGVKNYNRITYKDVYPNIDWVVYVKEGMLEYDFVVRPGGKIADIKLQYRGAENLILDKTGALHIKTPLGEVTEQRPFSFQENGEETKSRFVLNGSNIGFEVPGYITEQALTIDPGIVWATYYGGEDMDKGVSTALDDSGNVFLAGFTESTAGIASGGFDNTHNGDVDAFLVKFNAAGERLWSTYFGGPDYDYIYSCAVDGSGNVYLAGNTSSASGIASGGHQNAPGSTRDAFLVKFSPAGARLWATYYGGTSYDWGSSCAVDANDNVFLAGHTESSNGIASGGFQNSRAGNNDAFVVKFNPDGARLWGTYYGGSGDEILYFPGLAVDGSGNVMLGAITGSNSGIASAGAFQETYGGNYDAFLVKFNPNGDRLWSTYYGGSYADNGNACAVDATGNIFLTGGTAGPSGLASGGFQNANNGLYDVFLVKFNPGGERLWSTYYGGESNESGQGCATDGTGNVMVVGRTESTTGVASGGFQNTYGGGRDAFLVKISTAGSLLWGSYLGGVGEESGESCTADGYGNLYFAGRTQSTSGIASGGFKNTYGGGEYDAFLLKIADAPPDADGDGVPDAEDCAPNDSNKYQSAELYLDSDNDGYDAGKQTVCYGAEIPLGYKVATLGTDCNDNPSNRGASVYPGAPELCDGLDNDCDTQIDEGCPEANTWYLDYDKDGYGNPDKKIQSLIRRRGYVSNPDDCRDWDASIHPGAVELPDGLDNNCNGQVDEGLECRNLWYLDRDGDGYGNINYPKWSCRKPHRFVDNADDCRDWDARYHPGAIEWCDKRDNDCDGLIDEDCGPISEEITVNPGAGVNPLAKSDIILPGISIFPNPASDVVMVTLNGFETGKKLELMLVQADGKPLLSQGITPTMQGQQVRMDVRRLAAGYYLLQVKQGFVMQTKRVLIIR